MTERRGGGVEAPYKVVTPLKAANGSAAEMLRQLVVVLLEEEGVEVRKVSVRPAQDLFVTWLGAKETDQIWQHFQSVCDGTYDPMHPPVNPPPLPAPPPAPQVADGAGK
uniref:Uncharacterized protein n=1 Tax=Chromera velia CCMP2878 TaxID=1169474 RepID=A0A0G4IAP3_9ALVE|eukprot:Cvel_2114.t1-p1 / transcript=Cvel_2114.t1 / gene=Cvel_2114 / organism=Chromera_velia_CCMP2878 / gene_product=hypothetical protein / transcript_product=hypothetical protein / location=Cvel_scaffold81:145232-145985(-) / protein_length=108 / sequence_SO=supercontig / SO=protein_coding / is_pseudo=false